MKWSGTQFATWLLCFAATAGCSDALQSAVARAGRLVNTWLMVVSSPSFSMSSFCNALR
jgi:hypothetical protein